MWSTQSRTSAQSMKQKFFSNSFAFSVIQQMLAIWPLVPLPFLNRAVHLEVLIHMLLKPSLKNFEHSLPSMWNEWNCTVIWRFFGIAFLGIEMKINLFQSCGHCWVFQICWHNECSTDTASPFRISNSSARIPSPLLPSYLSSIKPFSSPPLLPLPCDNFSPYFTEQREAIRRELPQFPSQHSSSWMHLFPHILQ